MPKKSKSKAKPSLAADRQQCSSPPVSIHWLYILGALPVLVFSYVYYFRFQQQSPADNQIQSNNSTLSSCGIVMAKSAIPGAGWGLFAMQHFQFADRIMSGGPVIQLFDLQEHHGPGIRHLINNYAHYPASTGALHESSAVSSLIPGIGMLANADRVKFNVAPGNIWGYDSAGIDRRHPAVGSFTMYHSRTYFATGTIEPGQEIVLDYGTGWEERLKPVQVTPQHEIAWLTENGMCVDNLRQGKAPGKGLGAFANRYLQQGTLIAPLPLATIHRSSLDMEYKAQLMLNYCFGHARSSLLLFPYSPIVNLINHNNATPNARVEWSYQHMDTQWFQKSAEEVLESKRTGDLVAQLVALRDIAPGEEVTMDYGATWDHAWKQHVANFRPQFVKHAVSSHDFNATLRILRTPEELQTKPYPRNVRTVCFYDIKNQQLYRVSPTQTQAEWRWTESTPHAASLRPCTVHRRDGDLYVVEIHNWDTNSSQDWELKEGERHLVAKVPRVYITFVDNMYASNQHLPNAFRHEIGMPDFPEAWMDL